MIKKNSNTPKSRFGSKRDTKKKIVTYIRFWFWNVWIFDHTHGHSLGIGTSTKRLFGLEKL